jgi:hypothetical protein
MEQNPQRLRLKIQQLEACPSVARVPQAATLPRRQAMR